MDRFERGVADFVRKMDDASIVELVRGHLEKMELGLTPRTRPEPRRRPVRTKARRALRDRVIKVYGRAYTRVLIQGQAFLLWTDPKTGQFKGADEASKKAKRAGIRVEAPTHDEVIRQIFDQLT